MKKIALLLAGLMVLAGCGATTTEEPAEEVTEEDVAVVEEVEVAEEVEVTAEEEVTEEAAVEEMEVEEE